MLSWEAPFLTLDRLEANSLETHFTEEEIRRELIGIDRNKAPGPDGFMARFAQSFWPDFKDGVISMFNSLTRLSSIIFFLVSL